MRTDPTTRSLHAGVQPRGKIARATSAPARDTWRHATIIYWSGAAVLALWIAGLIIAQPNRDDAYQRVLIAYGLLFLFTVGAVATGVLCLRKSKQALIAAIFTATLIFVAAWFSALAVHPLSGVLFKKHAVTFVVLAIPIGLMVWVARRVVRSPTGQWNAPRWAGWACCLFPALVVPLFVARLSGASPVVEAHSMRVVWAGLDVFELAAMMATGYFIRRRSFWLVYTATALGSLLCCDAWFNVLSSTGFDLALAIALAFVEIPLAIYSFALAAMLTSRAAPPAPRAPARRQSRDPVAHRR